MRARGNRQGLDDTEGAEWSRVDLAAAAAPLSPLVGVSSQRDLYDSSVPTFFSLDRSPIRQLSAIQVEIPSLGNTHRFRIIQATMKMMRSQRFSMIPPNRGHSDGRVDILHAFP
jgi:hypothetical protein